MSFSLKRKRKKELTTFEFSSTLLSPSADVWMPSYYFMISDLSAVFNLSDAVLSSPHVVPSHLFSVIPVNMQPPGSLPPLLVCIGVIMHQKSAPCEDSKGAD